jgi:hypothetical protein
MYRNLIQFYSKSGIIISGSIFDSDCQRIFQLNKVVIQVNKYSGSTER